MASSTIKPLNRNANKVARKVERAALNPWVERLERYGYLVRGLIYFIIGALAVQLAIGAGGATTDQTGAIAMLGAQPMGRVLLVLVAVGLAGYSLWGFIRAILDPLERGTGMKGIVERIGFLVSGISYGALVIPAVRYATNAPGGQSTGEPAALSAQLFTQPFGPWLVIGFGLLWIAAAAGQFYSAYTAHFVVDFKRNAMTVREFKWARSIGRFGFAARGVVFGLIGLFVLESGLTMDPHKAVGFDGALLKIAQAPYGPILLAAVAFGLVAFGVYSALAQDGTRWANLSKMATTATRVTGDARLQPSNPVLAVVSLAWVVLATMALVTLAFAAHTTPYFGIDLAIAHAVQSIHGQWFDLLMRAVDWPGFPPQVYGELGLLLLFLCLTHRRWEAFSVAFASVGVGAVGLLIKVLVDRPRPSPELIHVNNPALDGGKFSFTAGHVEAYVAILGFIWFLAYISQNRSVRRALMLLVLGALIIMIGVSRVYSGEHWFSDVIGGYLFGSIWLILTIRVYTWGKPRFLGKGRGGETKQDPRTTHRHGD